MHNFGYTQDFFTVQHLENNMQIEYKRFICVLAHLVSEATEGEPLGLIVSDLSALAGVISPASLWELLYLQTMVSIKKTSDVYFSQTQILNG